MENQSIDEPLIQLKAFDVDIGKNGQVKYQLVLDPLGIASIDSVSGILRLKRRLMPETYAKDVDRPFARLRLPPLIVMAVDGGHPAKVSFVNVTIVLEDVNNNPALFLDPIFRVIF